MKARGKDEKGGGALSYQADPIRASLDILGRKWTFLILRDIAFLKVERFGEIRRNNPGLTARVLSRRLSEMTREGLLVREEGGEKIRYRLTAKGEDAVYILLALLRYGIRHHMGGRGELDEERIIKRLRYETPFGPREDC
jgi:DNA-binding HxlR family transcriptional regulator